LLLTGQWLSAVTPTGSRTVATIAIAVDAGKASARFAKFE